MLTTGEDWIDVGLGKIRVTAERDPSKLPHKDLGVDIAFECTGLFTARDKAAAHLTAGAKLVLISAPGRERGQDHRLRREPRDADGGGLQWSPTAHAPPTASRPVAKVLLDLCGIERGYMTTIHSYTGDQPTLDTMHKDLYRGRAAAMSMIPTSTGAAKALGLVSARIERQARRFLRARADAQRLGGGLEGRDRPAMSRVDGDQ